MLSNLEKEIVKMQPGKGRPAKKSSRGVRTVAISDELFEDLYELAQGSGIPISQAADYIFKNGLKNVRIETETVTRKRLVFED